ncbi:MAG: hypothetical protein KAJ10_07305 [Thermodesulfovibrionia bacterium]|nr:hypothetical protein [Thermodesulfovibrionia bacterium]
MGTFDSETGIYTVQNARQTDIAKAREKIREQVSGKDTENFHCPKCDGICEYTDCTSYYEMYTCKICGYIVEVN